MRITVLLGGTSSERDVSLASGIRIADALRSRGHDVRCIDPAYGPLSGEQEQGLRSVGVVKTAPPPQDELRRLEREALPRLARHLPQAGDVDVVFLGLHGGIGEDGTLQALLDLTGLPYTGSGHLASALAMDKDLSKSLFRRAGVPTADWILLRPDSEQPKWPQVVDTLGIPLIVKPSKQGSTVGLTVVKEAGGLAEAVAEAYRFDDEVLLERYVPGREITVAILGGEALPAGEIIPKHEIYDYECKYTPGMAVEEFPARLTATQAARVEELAKRAFRALKLRGCARIDFRMGDDNEFYCLEANTLPGMTGTSLVPQAAAAAGIGFPELCDRIARLGVEHVAGTQRGGGKD